MFVDEEEEIEGKQAVWEWQNPYGWASYDAETSKFCSCLTLNYQPV
jgi:hypothetical protein